MEKIDRKVMSDVAVHGWHVVVVPPDSVGPGFSHTIGLTKTYKHPEVILFGLPPETGHRAMEAVVALVKKGQKIRTNRRYTDILKNMPCVFRKFPRTRYGHYLEKALDFYGEAEFEAYQLFWPDKEERFPWQKDFSRGMRKFQPTLNSK